MFVEMMACRGGCVGGGQPYGADDKVRKRATYAVGNCQGILDGSEG